jgi:arylsulfatase A-like enzyme
MTKFARNLGPLQRFLTYLIAVTPLLFLPSCTVDSKPVSRPNVVFIMADDMGWGDVQAYNPESLIATPNIDRLSQEGLTFMDAHSGAAVCSPTRYGVMTGRFFWRTYKGHSLVMPYDPPTIPPERMTWGSLMQKQGYETGYIGKWHLGLWYPSKPQQGFARQYTMNEMQVDFSKPVLGGPTDLGFDYFFGNAGGPNNDSPFAFIENDRWVEEPTVMTPPEMAAQPGVVEGLMVPDWDQEKVDTHLTERAVSFISNHVAKAPDQPFFLYYSLSAPHIPFTPPDFIKGASQAGPRGDMNALVDWVVGEIRDELEKEGVLDNTILIFTSDNGPRRGEKGLISTNVNDSSPIMPKLYLNDGTTEFGPETEPNNEPEYGHQRKWVDACKAGFNSAEHRGLTSSFDYAGPMTETVLMGNLAIRSYMLRRENSNGGMDYYGRKKLLWDGENMRITNLEEANQFVGRTYRDGFAV